MGKKEKITQTLIDYVCAARPIIYINHFDYHAVDSLIADVSGGDYKIFEFREGIGEVDFETKMFSEHFENLKDFLAEYDKLDSKVENRFLVLKDIHTNFIGEKPDIEVIARLRSIAERQMYQEFFTTIFIVDTELIIPPEISMLTTVVEMPNPSREEISNILVKHAENSEYNLDEVDKNELVEHLIGLSEFEILQIINIAYIVNNGKVDNSALSLITTEKEKLIKKTKLLELIHIDTNIDDVGGLENLKDYLRNKAKIFANLGEAKKFGVDTPKGLMIVGMPGCGKSLSARAAAKEFGVPLIRLDVGKLMGKYVGESENNLNKAIRIAESTAPCVLWIDEIEKAFSGVGSSGGASDISTRLFGQFLTWLQEKTSLVYVIATANSTNELPAELKRKGRFDEIFFVDLPNEKEREIIFQVHIDKRVKKKGSINIRELIKGTQGYCGADIEAVVKETVERKFISDNKDITTSDFIETIKATKSIKDMLGKELDGLMEKNKSFNVKPASRP